MKPRHSKICSIRVLNYLKIQSVGQSVSLKVGQSISSKFSQIPAHHTCITSSNFKNNLMSVLLTMLFKLRSCSVALCVGVFSTLEVFRESRERIMKKLQSLNGELCDFRL